MNKTKYETVSSFYRQLYDNPIHKSFKLFNKYAESLTLIYGTLQFSLDQYAVAVESKYQWI